MAATTERRAQVRQELAAGDVPGLRVLADRLEAHGFTVTPDELRADVRALGAVRVEHGEGSVLALPVDGDSGASAPVAAPKLTAVVSADPDWRLQVGVAAVVVVFLVVALLGWLIS
ncbi:hypothetical protein [Aquihabitans sp. McL0605]|uniref:hypothetical protein n=1 Tax=Aquihabitans sp. McL0605 TaxID=3415671 RepID=UPI003CE789F2